MIKRIITEISEEDFRKLYLKVSRNEIIARRSEISGRDAIEWKMCEVPVNEILDEQIAYLLNSGYASDLEALKEPVTLAIHEPGGYYMDKFMNRFTGAQTFQLGFGIKHLYSTRDYYECHDGDYWRVNKNETKVIYRIKLDSNWANRFVLKHKSELLDWPYDSIPDGEHIDGYEWIKLEVNYDLDDDGQWVEVSRCAIIKYKYSKAVIPIDKDGNRKKPEWENQINGQ